MLTVVPPEVLRYLIIRTKPEKHIRFDPALPLLTLVDEFERLHSSDKATSYDRRIIELSHAAGLCHTDIPFKHMTTIYQVAAGDFERILNIVKRAGYDTTNEKCIRELVDNVGNWLEVYAPDNAKFSVQDELPVSAAQLNDLQRAFLSSFASILDRSGELNGEDYHNLVYSAKEQGSELNTTIADAINADPSSLEVNTKELFKAIYVSVLGQPSGPKAGWFLSSLEKDFLAQRFKEAAEYRP
jgi:lysyl-tRNA synthetase class 1